MQFVIVHNHFRPGGVRRVIEEVTPCLVKALRPRVRQIVLAGGEAPDENWLRDFRRLLGPTPVICRTNAALGYVAEQPFPPALIARRARSFLEETLAQAGPKNCVVWAHNQGLGRNLPLTRELERICAQRSVPLIFHHHDWWFDNRWQRRPEMRRAGFRSLAQIAQAIFISGPNVRCVTINQADHRVLQRHFPQHAAWLPNPVAKISPISEARLRAARSWLWGQIGQEAPVWLMPCRLLRRKNIAEALLLTRWLRPEAWLVTTGGVSSAEEQTYAERLEAAAQQHGWRLRLGVLQENESAKPSVADLLAASETALLTSCQEGFGLPYLEAATSRRPLIGRTLPNIAPDLAQFGFRFPQQYREVMVDPSLFDWAAEQRRQARLFEAWRRQLPRSYQKLAGRPVLLSAQGHPSAVAVSRLTLTAQLEVLAQPLEISWKLCVPLNPFLSTWRKHAEKGKLGVTKFPRSASRRLNAQAYAQRFARMLAARPSPCPLPIGWGEGERKECSALAAQDEFIRQKLQSENLYPLTWAPET